MIVLELTRLSHNQDADPLSLEYIKLLPSPDAFAKLIQYDRIGPKTAACVILFCLQRPCYAVDTHVWRLTKWLGWVPEKANEIKTFAHGQARVPEELMHRLHQLFWQHGRRCPRCRAETSDKSKGWEEGCPIEHLVKRTGVMKDGGRGAAGSVEVVVEDGDDGDDGGAEADAAEAAEKEI
jgi:DNA-(apurinic or apyrimidinic site) lyase